MKETFGISVLASNVVNNVVGITSLQMLQNIVIFGMTLGAWMQIILWIGAFLVALKYLGDVIINGINIYSHFKNKGKKDDRRTSASSRDSDGTR